MQDNLNLLILHSHLRKAVHMHCMSTLQNPCAFNRIEKILEAWKKIYQSKKFI